ncbi:MAG TPA: linear amide C-N hydrolase [Pyrinomonadaceae bacterium]|nr:linear amide C-N hydrolase [Pyrinomonadaceae bacterium]
MIKKLTCSIFILVCLALNQALACTTFCLRGKGEVLFGRNYDWDIGDALIFVNKRGVAKMSAEESSRPARWVSRYGSVTFNQYGRENPTGGMNREGLVVEQMWLDETQYSKDPALPTIGTQDWMQYLLDTSATTAEAIKNAERVRIVTDVKVHYLVSDKNGDTAAIEFVGGKMVVHTGPSLPVATLTNDTYENSIKAKAAAVGEQNSNGSLDRFVRAAQRTEAFSKQPKSGQEAVNYAFEVLSNAAQRPGTVWSIVYDIKRGWIYFRTAESPQIKSIDVKAFDYSCGTPVKMFDINARDSGDVTAKFAVYTRKANRDLIERSFNGTNFLKDIPAGFRNEMAAYPESFKCSQSK